MFANFFCGVLLLVSGVLMFIFRNDLGNFTDYYAGKGGYVDSPTPGWMLIPFAIALAAGGLLLMIKSTGLI